MNLDNYYFLLHAYDHLGRRVYGDKWRLEDFWSGESPNPDEMAAQRKPLEERERQISEEIENLKEASSKTVTKEEKAMLSRERETLIRERVTVRAELVNIGDPENFRTRYDAFLQIEDVREKLFDALRREDIKAQIDGGRVFEFRYLEGKPHFKVHLDLSLAQLPRYDWGKKRGTILINRDCFDDWLNRHYPEGGNETPKAKFAEYMRREVANGKKRMSRDQYVDFGVREFGTSKNAARSVWQDKDIVPDKWRLGGRPSDIKTD